MDTLSGSHNQLDETVVTPIVSAVSTYEQCDPLDLPPLYRAVDTDALNQVTQELDSTAISFSYHGYYISIDDDGHVDVTPEQE